LRAGLVATRLVRAADLAGAAVFAVLEVARRAGVAAFDERAEARLDVPLVAVFVARDEAREGCFEVVRVALGIGAAGLPGLKGGGLYHTVRATFSTFPLANEGCPTVGSP